MPNRIPRLLYIDDDPALCRLVEKNLSRHGYIVQTANSGRTGLQCLREERFDLVALDHNMPEQDGLETLKAISSLPDPPPVIYVTGAMEGRVAVTALNNGAVNYVIKEITSDFLVLLRAAADAAFESLRQRRLRERAESELRLSRDRFEALANERATLIAEINHRVSNSLQLIASLLQVQGMAQKNVIAAEILLDANKRVAAVARVHQRLYSSDDVRYIDLADYLVGLVDDLRQSIDHGGGSLQVLASQTKIGADFAIPIGLLVTELVINALKHAYPGGSGPIRVRAERQDRSILLVVEDDGVGVNETEWRGGGMGNRIVVAMVDKIRGRLSIRTGPTGTAVGIEFDAANPPAISDSVQTSVLVVTESVSGAPRLAPAAARENPVIQPRLLLIEDDAMMRLVVAGNLEALGYRVEEAGSAEEARRHWQSCGERFSAVIVDIGLPDCRGDDLAAELRAGGPRLPMILASGYDEKKLRRSLRDDPYIRIVAKPYSDTELMEALLLLGVAAPSTGRGIGGQDRILLA